MNQTYIRLLQAIELFAQEHLQIQKFSSDFPEQIPNFATKDEAYPILYVSPSNAIFNLNTNRFDLRVFCYDVIQKDRGNINTILSDTNSILNDLVLWLREGDLVGIDLVNEPRVTPINNELLDYVAGWELTLTLEVDTYTVCDIPFNDMPVILEIVNNIVYTKYLTCSTLEDCDTFTNAIDNLQEQINNLTGGTEFDCAALTGCTVIQDINSELSGLTSNINALSATTEDINSELSNLTSNINALSATTEQIKEDYIPYTGATKDVNLGDNSIQSNIGFSIDKEGLTSKSAYIGNFNNDYINLYVNTDSNTGVGGNTFTINPEDGMFYNKFVNNLSSLFKVTNYQFEITFKTGNTVTNQFYTNDNETYSLKKVITNEGFNGNYVQFNTGATETSSVGKLNWNDTDGTLDLGLKGGNVTLQLGQENVIRVVNKTGTNLLEANYQAVKVDGAQGNRLKVALAQANSDLNSAETIGIVTETINNNQEGFVTTNGLVRGINTTGSLQGETWADGDMLYLSPTVAGRLTKIKPVAPQHLIVMGYVVRAHQTQGQIFVKIDNGYELGELHDCLVTGATNGQVLSYSAATQVWVPRTITDTTVTGATKSGSIATFTNNTGGTFTLTGLTDTIVTGGTYSNGTTVFTNNTGGTFSVSGYSTGYTLTSSAITDTLGYIPAKINAEQTTGVILSFTTDRVYGTLITPETATGITANVTGGKLGVTCLLIHNNAVTAPTFSSVFKKLSGSGNYVTGQINYIFFNYITDTEIIYSINQRT